MAKEAFLPTKSSSRTPRALEHAPHTWIGVPSATVVRRASARGGPADRDDGIRHRVTHQRHRLAQKEDLDLVTGLRQCVRMQKWKRCFGRVVGTLLIPTSQLKGSRCGFAEKPSVDRKVGGGEAAENYLLDGRELLHGGSDAGDSNLRREFDRVALDR